MNDADARLPPHEVGRMAGAVLDAVGTVRGRQAGVAGAGPGRHPGRRARAAGGPARAGQDADRAVASPRRSGSDFRRLQFTPDLLPADVTGSFLYDQRSARLHVPGRARSSPTCCWPTRSTGRRRRPRRRCWRRCRRSRSRSRAPPTGCDPPFHVLATANPIEYEGTYPLPEAQLDRFLLRVSFGYPTADEEWEVLRRRMARRQEEARARAGGGRRRPCWRCRPRWRTWRSRTRSAGTSSRWPRRPGSTRRCWSARRRAARWRCCCWPGPGRAGRPRLRGARGRQGGRGARAGAPDHAAAGDVAAPGRPGVRGRRGARRRRPAPASGALPTYAGRPRLRALTASPPVPAGSPTAGLGADPGARPGGAAHRGAAVRSPCCSAGSTWWCWPPRSRSAPRCALRRRPAARRRLEVTAAEPHVVEGGERRRPRSTVGNPDVVGVRPGGGPDPRLAAGCALRSTSDRPYAIDRRSPAPSAPRVDLTGRRAALGPARRRPGRAPAAAAADGLLVCRAGASPALRRAGVPGDRAVRRRRGDAARRRAGRRPPLPAAGRGRRAGRGPRVRPRRPAAPHRLAGLAAHPRTARRGDPVRPGRRGGRPARRAARGGPLRRGATARASVLDTTVRAAAAHRRALPAPRRPGRRCWSTAARPAGCARAAAAGTT